jgi:hypothetical protein
MPIAPRDRRASEMLAGNDAIAEPLGFSVTLTGLRSIHETFTFEFRNGDAA